MFPIQRSVPILSLGALAVLAGPTAAQYTIYGAGCGLPLALSSDTAPLLGMNYDLQLDQAPPGLPAILILGLSAQALPLGLIGFDPNCTLLASPDVLLLQAADGAGHAHYDIPIPVLPSLVGASIYNQWAVFDLANPFVFEFSAGGTASIANPQLAVAGLVPLVVLEGTVVTAQAFGLGTTDPANLCMRLVFGGGSTLLRVDSIVHQANGSDLVTATAVTVPPGGTAGFGALALMRGNGATQPTPTGGNGVWVWAGPDLPEAGGMEPAQQTMPAPPPPPLDDFRFTYDGANANGPCITATILPASYPTGSQFVADAHWNVVNHQPGHYDTFLPPITITAAMNEFQVRDLVSAALQSAFDAAFPGAVAFTNPTATASIEIRMTGGVQLQAGYSLGHVYRR